MDDKRPGQYTQTQCDKQCHQMLSDDYICMIVIYRMCFGIHDTLRANCFPIFQIKLLSAPILLAPNTEAERPLAEHFIKQFAERYFWTCHSNHIWNYLWTTNGFILLLNIFIYKFANARRVCLIRWRKKWSLMPDIFHFILRLHLLLR